MTDLRLVLLAGAAVVAGLLAAIEAVFERRGPRPILLRTALALLLGAAAWTAVSPFADLLPIEGNPLGGRKYVWGAAYAVFLLVRAAVSAVALRRAATAPLAAAFALVFLLGAFPWFALPHTVGGDDIWYVLMAFSLVDDGDFLIDDEIRSTTYRRWIDVRASDGTFLRGMQVDPAAPPARTKAFFGASLVLAPAAWVVASLPFLDRWESRLFLGVPGLFAGAATFGLLFAVSRRVAGGRSEPVVVPFALLLLATPIPFWFLSLSPDAFLPLATVAGVWAATALPGRGATWAGLAAWSALPWLHPRVIPSAILGAVLLPPPAAGPLYSLSVVSASLAAKVAVDRLLGLGLFAGYAGDAGYVVGSPAAYAESLLGPWIGADTSFLLYAPVTVLGVAGGIEAWRGAGPSVARRLAIWIAAQVLLLGLTRAWHGVNGIGRLYVDLLYPLMILAPLAASPARGAGVLAAVGGAWNLLFMAVPLLWFYLPSGSLARYAGLDLAWILPEFGGEATHFRRHYPSGWIPALWTVPLAAWWVRRFLPRAP